MIVTAKWCSAQQAVCWYRLLTRDQVTGSDPSFCFAFMSCYCLLKNTKSIRELVMVRNKKWITRSFIEGAKLYLTKEWTKLCWHTFSNTGCFSTIYASLEADGFSEKYFIYNSNIHYRFQNSPTLSGFVHFRHYNPYSWSLIFIFLPCTSRFWGCQVCLFSPIKSFINFSPV